MWQTLFFEKRFFEEFVGKTEKKLNFYGEPPLGVGRVFKDVDRVNR